MKVLASMLAALLLGSAMSAQAVLMEYQISGTASGAIDGENFSDQAFSIDLIGDTANFHSTFVETIDPLASASITLAGVGTAYFPVPMRIGINNSVSTTSGSRVFFSLSDELGGLDLLHIDVGAPLDLTSEFGPVAAVGSVLVTDLFHFIPLSFGELSFDAASDVLLQSRLAASVPEPGSLGLFGAGAACLALARRTRRMRCRQRRL